MSEKPLISLVLPVYNIESYLPVCMENVLGQTYTRLEILLVDDGSTDGCPALCDSYAEKDPRVRALHKENGGLSDARNFGIRHAEGEYISLIDPDDTVDLDYVEYLYDLAVKYRAPMSICQHRVLFLNGRVEEFGKPGDRSADPAWCLEHMLYHDVIDTSAWAKLYHRSLFETVSYPVGRIFEDIGTTYALFMQCSVIAVGFESKYNYWMHASSIVNASFSKKKLDLPIMTDRMGKAVLKEYPHLYRAVLRRRVYARLSTINQMLDTREYADEKKKMIAFVREHAGEILSDPKAPKRDKMAILLLRAGYPVYRAAWKSYLYVKKGR
jgi:glycosyltransferase involved in cell wall biosynthesis